MKIKKYVAKTEQEAMEAAKAELGKDAVVISIKKTQPKGLFAFFRQPTVEVTAAYEDKGAQGQVSQPGINQVPMPPPKMPDEAAIQLQNEAEFKNNQQSIAAMAEEVVGARKGFKDKFKGFGRHAVTEEVNVTNFNEISQQQNSGVNLAVGETPTQMPQQGFPQQDLQQQNFQQDFQQDFQQQNFQQDLQQQSFQQDLQQQNYQQTPDVFQSLANETVAGMNKSEFSEIKGNILNEQQEKINQLQQEIESKEKILEQVLERMSGLEEISNKSDKVGRYSNTTMQLMYDVLTDQGVDDRIAQKILEELDLIEDNDKLDINFIVKIVYNNIINILNGGKGVEISSDTNKVVCFIGPTGVGKTTTIAKLSSKLILEDKAKVGLITADTYRIAAVQQLKTYADILGIDIGVCYNNKDLMEQLGSSRDKNEVVLIDTAGCSIKNTEMIEDLSALVHQIPEAQKFLVLSLTTKWQDLVNIINSFGKITSFDLILTKMDETTSFGSILNLCHMTKQKIAYITNGQSVPNDIEAMSPEKIAKALLEFGGEENV